jgi:FKBP-type peptidyl-prolyl cis-trans isomerase SlyD
MKVQVVSFHCVLKNKFGKVLSSTFNQDILMGYDPNGDRLVALTKGLQNLTLGERRRVDLSAAEAYGFYDPKRVIRVLRQDLAHLPTEEGERQPIMLTHLGEQRLFRVVEVSGETVVLDGNHPLAGLDLVFEIEATAVRDATADEIGDSRTTTPHLIYNSRDRLVRH